MAQLDKTTYEGTYNSGVSGLFKDNTTNDIEAVDMRSLVTDTKDSFLNKTDESYTAPFPQFTTSTSTTAYVGTPSPVITAYATGQKFQVKIHATSTGSATLNLNGLGAKKIFTDPTTQAGTNNLVINQIYVFFYDAALDSAAGGFLMVGGGASVSDASETVKGIVEEATDAEVLAGTATGGTGAKLFISPAKFQTLRSLSRTTAAVSAGTMNLDLTSGRERKFENLTTQSSNFAITFSNDTNAEIFTCVVFITGAVVITMPSSVVMEEDNSRWTNGSKLLTLTGGTASPFVLSWFRISSTLFELRASTKIYTS